MGRWVNSLHKSISFREAPMRFIFNLACIRFIFLNIASWAYDRIGTNLWCQRRESFYVSPKAKWELRCGRNILSQLRVILRTWGAFSFFNIIELTLNLFKFTLDSNPILTEGLFHLLTLSDSWGSNFILIGKMPYVYILSRVKVIFSFGAQSISDFSTNLPFWRLKLMNFKYTLL